MQASPDSLPEPGHGLRIAVRLYVLGLGILGTFFLAATPLLNLDFDLWYHLAHGRYLFEHGTPPPSSAHFSFLEPRTWIDYYWLFQAVIYPVHQVAGYPGLLVLRALVYAALLATVAVTLLRGERDPGRLLLFAFVVGLTANNLMLRFEVIRPHMVSYLALALFVLILERLPRAVVVLPLFAVIWVNAHGVAYPVMMLVVGAYLAETLWRRRQQSHADDARASTVRLASLGLCLLAVFANPWGADLVRAPFLDTDFASAIIGELLPFSTEGLFTFTASASGGLLGDTAFELLAVLGLAAVVLGITRRELELAPVLLALGGVFLLTKGVRFVNELNLLMLPLLLRSSLPAVYLAPVALSRPDPTSKAPSQWGGRWHTRWPIATLLCVILALPMLTLARRIRDAPPTYPLDTSRLPTASVHLLNSLADDGSVTRAKLLHGPNLGGFLLWALNPTYKITLTLETPFLFHDEDVYALLSAFRDPSGLASFLATHQPDFLLVPLYNDEMPRFLERYPRYRMIFFDDAAALYVDAAAHPGVAASALRQVDPFTLATTRFSGLDPAARQALLRELESVLARAPELRLANQAVAILHNLDGQHTEALERIDRALAKAPTSAAYAVRGDALQALGRCPEALASYADALRSARAAERKAVERSRTICLLELGRDREAYASLKSALGLVNPKSSWRDLEQLALLAARVGEPHQARTLLRFALGKIPPDAVNDRRRLIASLAELEP